MSAQLHLDNLSDLRGDCVKKKKKKNDKWKRKNGQELASILGKMVEKEEQQNGGTFSNSECGIC